MTALDNTCAAYEAALVAQALSASTSADLAAHLTDCPACRRKLAAYRQMREGLLCGPFVSPGENLVARLMRMARHRLTGSPKKPLRPLPH
ncbi:hypothetical protein EKD04_013095 [Chloroflexales bacterium ZM16-3]|nr:hypothetical protein [Chloroflexales bacterium ZM16-3]